jgi:Ca-activated chloride channel family protein
MQTRSLAVLTVLAMSLTSVTVWSVTPEVGRPMRAMGGLTADLALPIAPDQSGPFNCRRSMRVQARLGHPVRAVGSRSQSYLMVDVQPDVASVAAQLPLDLAILIDRSGSMRGKRMRNALAAARTMIHRLRDGDLVRVVAYDTRAEVVVPASRISSGVRQRVIQQLEGLRAGGDTCISCALDLGMRDLGGGNGNEGRMRHMLLLSDGQATSGIRRVDAMGRLAALARQRGVTISTIGVDVSYNEKLMSTIAREGNGRHYFAEQAGGLNGIFSREVRALTDVVAHSAELRLRLAPGVEVSEVFDRAFRREGSQLVVPFGAFSRGEAKTLLVAVDLPAAPEGMAPVAQVDLKYRRSGAADLHCGGKLMGRATAERREHSMLDPVVAARLERSRTARLLRSANAEFGGGKEKAARRRLKKKRASIAQRRRNLPRSMPRATRRGVERDFDAQLAALDEAADGFASPPPPKAGAAPAPASKSRRGRAQVRRNESRAHDLGL